MTAHDTFTIEKLAARLDLVERWNRVTEVWRENDDFRDAVLRYATQSAWRDPACASAAQSSSQSAIVSYSAAIACVR